MGISGHLQLHQKDDFFKVCRSHLWFNASENVSVCLNNTVLKFKQSRRKRLICGDHMSSIGLEWVKVKHVLSAKITTLLALGGL